MNWEKIAQSGHLKALEALVQTNGDANSLVDGINRTPLHYAAEEGHVEAVRFLISKSASVDPRDRYGRSPLYMAVFQRHEKVASVLLDSDADPDVACQCGTTAVSKAAEHGDMQTLELLLKKGAKTQTENIDGETPEYLAWHNGHDEVAGRFRYHRAKRSREFRQAAQKGSVTTMRRLLDCEVRANDRDLQSRSALDLAAQYGQTEAVSFLLEVAVMKANDAKHMHKTALHWAAQEGHVAVVDILLRHGSNIEARDDAMMTPLHRAAERGRDRVVTTICRFRNKAGSARPNVDVRGPNGVTPLMLASRQGRKTTVRLLLDLGADANLLDGREETARDKALDHGHADVMNILSGGNSSRQG